MKDSFEIKIEDEEIVLHAAREQAKEKGQEHILRILQRIQGVEQTLDSIKKDVKTVKEGLQTVQESFKTPSSSKEKEYTTFKTGNC